jgi:5,6-dimethylbenzimidazole synthase
MSAAPDFSDAERAAVYRVIRERRDVRRFSDRLVPADLLWRLLGAACQAPSVGYMQPWNFLLIRSLETRRQVRDAFARANAEAAARFPEDRRPLYTSLKLEGIVESSWNVVVTCDRQRSGPVVLGRTHQPDMDLYSVVCAVHNFWLAARAEGVGVGWVSIFDADEVKNLLGIPAAEVLIAYLCVGYPEGEFAPQPELKTAGWLPEVALSEIVFAEHWGQRAGPEAIG